MLKKQTLLFLLTISLTLFAQPNANAPLGVNLSGIVSWAEGYAFVDAFKSARPWIAQLPGQPWGEGGAIATDADGWLTGLAPNQYVETVMLDGVADRPVGTYTLLYDGEGTFEFAGNATFISEPEPGRILVDMAAGTGGIWLRIMDTDPNGTGDYLRNIRFVMPGFETTYLTEPFHPDFLATWENFKVLRFMDWQDTNNSHVQTWVQRNTPDKQSQMSGAGVALEYCIQLANLLQADAWFCMPHQADNNYVTQFATMVYNDLDPNLRVYVEYSNEVWNGQFDQAVYAGDQGLLLGLAATHWEAAPLYYSQRSVEIFNIFETVFGGTSRLERTLAWQNVNVWGAAIMMDHNNAYLSADALAIAPYFGGYLGAPETQNIVDQMTVEEILDWCEADIAETMAGVRLQAENAHSRGLRLTAYEGGPHLVGYLGAENNTTMEALFIAANRDPRMQDLYMDYLNRWKEAGGEMFATFSSMARPSKWGSWGLLENYGEAPMSKPKYAAVQQFMECNTPPWWEGTPDPLPPVGSTIIDFQGTSIPYSHPQNRPFDPVSTGGITTGWMIPFSTAAGDHIFDVPGYEQAEFYGGFLFDYSPLPADPPTYNLSEYNDHFTVFASAGENEPSSLTGVFLWKKDQFLNGYDAMANVKIGQLSLNVPNALNGGELRFLIKNGSTYYISDFVATDIGAYQLNTFDNSSDVRKRWKEFTMTANDFSIPNPLIGFDPVIFDDVTEVGFIYEAARESWGHSFSFDSFTVNAIAPEELAVTINQAATQNDPSAVSPIHFTTVFNQSVSDFTTSDVLFNGTALPTSAIVTEVAPMDGTTYDIEVSGMSLEGSVWVRIPAGVANSSLGYPNLAATSSDHIVYFTITDPPTVTIDQATTQADPALNPPVYFTAVFSESIAGFDGTDVQLSGSAGATTAVVTEIAPMDGTTFSIEVTGMTADGTVLADIPSGTTFNLLGAANLASTSSDNVVNFYVSNPPLVTIDQAATQTDPAFVNAVHFTAIFNQAVTGFDSSNDLILSGSANPTTATIAEIAPFDGTTYDVAVSGMNADGFVMATIGAGVAQSVASGAGNLVSTSVDNEVFFFVNFPTGGTVINFDGAAVPDGPILNQVPVLDGGGTFDQIDFSTTVGDHIYTTTESQSEFYGGLKLDYAPNPTIGYNLEMRTNDTGFASNRFWVSTFAGENEPSEVVCLFMWKKEQFLNNMDLVPVGFDDDVANSRMAINVNSAGAPTLRFVVKNDGVYYISEYLATSQGMLELTAFNNTTEVGKRWGVFNPTASDFDMPNPLPAFQAVDFTDVTEVGFLYQGTRESWGNGFEFDSFTVDAINATPPTPSIEVHTTTLLEGAFNATTQLMNTTLNDDDLLPLGQPFNRSPWNYMGTETVASFPSNAVDWVLLGLYNSLDNAQLVAQQAGILLSNGMVVNPVNPDGSEGLFFQNVVADDYYVVLRSRHHLAVMSANPVTLPNTTASAYNFTTAETQALGSGQLIEVATGVFAQISGDFNSDGVISVADFNIYTSEAASINVYFDTDSNLDTNVTVADFNLYLPHASVIGVSQIRY